MTASRPHWEKVYSHKYQHKAEIVKGILESNGLFPVIVNKSVSPYGSAIGEYEVRVESDFVIKAMKIIREEIRIDE